MKVASRSMRTVLVLGAGATRGAVGRVRVHGKLVRSPLNRDFFKIASVYARAKGPAVLAKLDRINRTLKEDLPFRGGLTLEEAFSLLYVAKDLPEVFRTRKGPKPAPGDSKEIDAFLDILFGLLHDIDAASETSGYDRLVTCLESGDSVITLNYDTCLDSALHRAGWDPVVGYRLKGGSRKVRWPSITGAGLTLKGVSLLKLHGSANWWVQSPKGRISDVFSKKPALVTAPRGNGKQGYLRQIVPPIHGKFFAHDHWRHLWKVAHEALTNGDRLVVVGCSLVDTDFHFLGFLRSVAERRRREGNFREIVLVDRTRIRRRWTRILKGALPNPAQRTGYKTLEAFLTKGAKV